VKHQRQHRHVTDDRRPCKNRDEPIEMPAIRDVNSHGGTTWVGAPTETGTSGDVYRGLPEPSGLATDSVIAAPGLYANERYVPLCRRRTSLVALHLRRRSAARQTVSFNDRPGPILRNFSGCTISKVHV